MADITADIRKMFADARMNAQDKYRHLAASQCGDLRPGGPANPAPPMPQSAVINDVADRISDAVIALINSKPRSPTKEEIAAVVTEVVGATSSKADFLVVPREMLENREKAESQTLHFGMDFVDFGKEPGAVMRHFCRDTGLDPNPRCDACGERYSMWGIISCPGRPKTDSHSTARDVDPVELLKAGYLDGDNQIVPFEAFTQFDGPKMATYWARGGAGGLESREYQVFAYQSASLDRIVKRLHWLAEQLRDMGCTEIVWRQRPDITISPCGTYKFYARFHALPYVTLQGDKREGDATPEA